MTMDNNIIIFSYQ